MIHVYICPNTHCTQCILFNEKDEMIGLLDSSKALYLLSKINVVIVNPEELEDPNIILNKKGRISKNITVKKMMKEEYKPLDIVNTTGINIDIVHQIISREKKKNAIYK